MKNYQLVLSSTSPYRKALLEKLHYPFMCCAPSCDETPLINESPEELVKRLAIEKASSCGAPPDSLVIGSDQVCVIDGNIVGKPLTREKAITQLTAQSGKRISFITGISLVNTATNAIHTDVDVIHVHFRKLSPQQIEYYVDTEQPWYCAGSFMCEGLGISLFDKLDGDDPNTLIGLPLIKLIRLLEKEGLDILNPGP